MDVPYNNLIIIIGSHDGNLIIFKVKLSQF